LWTHFGSECNHGTLIAKHARNPKGQKRPADVIGNAVHVMRIAAGEITEKSSPPEDSKNQAAVELGRKGGVARAKNLSASQRSRIAKQAAETRWRTSPSKKR